ncbi:MAG: hypothetical protein WBA74_22050 [Cyclobacteriaceae bacterium]
MKYLFTGILILSTIVIKGQNLSIHQSKEGYVITNNDSIGGVITLDLNSNSILLKSKSGIRTLSAKLLKKVVLTDSKGVSRTFVSGFWGFEQKTRLFEQLVAGNNSLLYREGLKFGRYEEEESSAYFTLVNGSVYSLGTKKEIINLFTHKKKIADFVKEYKLDVNVREDLILLFSHANETSGLRINTVMAIEEL